MIATLFGTIFQKSTNYIIIEAGGVGYQVILPTRDIALLSLNTDVRILTYFHIRENSQELFGFLEAESKQLFEKLIGVKNVGPKVAIALLDIAQTRAIAAAIADGDVKFLQTAKGVGKRAAEQIVVELRDKIGVLASQNAEAIVTRAGIDHTDEATQALIALGFSDVDAQKALESIDKTLSVEERVVLALKR